MVRHELVRDDGGLTLRLHGELDWGGRLKLESVFEHAVESSIGGSLVIDLRDVSFVDSSGVSLLIETVDQSRRRGADLRILRPEPQVLRVFEVLGLADVLPFGEPIGA